MFLWKISPKNYPQYSKHIQYKLTLVKNNDETVKVMNTPSKMCTQRNSCMFETPRWKTTLNQSIPKIPKITKPPSLIYPRHRGKIEKN